MGDLREPIFPRLCQLLTKAFGNNTLIEPHSFDESKWLLLLNVVTMKKKRYWFYDPKHEYTAFDIPLSDLLIDKHALDVRIEQSIYCSYNPERAYSLNLSVKAGMKDVIGTNISAYDEGMDISKLEKLLQRKIEYSSFISALKERKLDMNHHFIREIKDTKDILCVITRVIITSDISDIEQRKETGGNIKVLEKLRGIMGVGIDIGGKVNSDRAMGLEPGTTLAYDVWELRVDLDSGEITPIMTTNHSGGFFNGDIREVEKCSLEKYKYFNDSRRGSILSRLGL